MKQTNYLEKAHYSPICTLVAANNFLISGSDDGSVKLWDRSIEDEDSWLGLELEAEMFHAGAIADLSYWERGRSLFFASASTEGFVRIWDECGDLQGFFQSYSNCSSVAFSCNGNTLAVGTEDGSIELWNGKTLHFSYRIRDREYGEERESITGVAFARKDTLLVATTSRAEVEVWSLASKKRLFSSLLNCDCPPKRLAGVTEYSIITAGNSRYCGIWQFDGTYRKSLCFEENVTDASVISPLQGIAIADVAGGVSFWELASGRKTEQFTIEGKPYSLDSRGDRNLYVGDACGNIAVFVLIGRSMA